MRIKAIREAKGLSLRVLASKAKMGYPYLCNVENGKADPSLSTLRRLAKALKVKVVELIDD
jgi:transcriptional regulator with XRE-family HTH domain